jgi:hypothetical protein
MDNLKLLNIDLNQIFIIVGAFLLAVLVYNQLINISSMLVIPSKKLRTKQLDKCSNCNI